MTKILQRFIFYMENSLLKLQMRMFIILNFIKIINLHI